MHIVLMQHKILRKQIYNTSTSQPTNYFNSTQECETTDGWQKTWYTI